MDSKLKLFNRILFFGLGITATLYFAAPVLIPLTWGIFLAALMRPVSVFFERKGVGRVLSSTFSTLIVLFGLSGLLYFIFSQSDMIMDQLPQIKEQVQNSISNFKSFLSQQLGIDEERINEFFSSSSENMDGAVQNVGQAIASNLFGSLLNFLLVMVFLFLLLLKRDKYEEFVLKYFEENKQQAKQVISKTSRVAGEYLSGRLQVMTILGIMYVITFFAFGIKGAILVTIVSTIFTVIPYIGPLISGLIPIIVVLISGRDFSIVLSLAIIVTIIQLIESYVLEPIILGSEVDLSPITIILAIIIGRLLWGISGMILFVPIFAIVKILCGEIDKLRPISFLLGHRKPQKIDIIGKVKALFNKK